MFGRQTILSSNYKKVFIKKRPVFRKISQTGLDSNHLINRDLSMITPIKRKRMKKDTVVTPIKKERGKERKRTK